MRRNQHDPYQPNEYHTYRLNPHTAKLLGLEPKKTNKYTLNKEQEKKLFSLDFQPIKRLFYDIETCQYEVRTFAIGYKRNIQFDDVIKVAKIICISYSWENENKVHSLSWDKNQCDKKLVSDFVKILNEADEIVAHNGDRFDLPWIRTRAAYHRIPMKANYRSLDTYKKIKKHFRLPNNKLDTAVQYFGIGEKVRHEGKVMWEKVLEGDKQALKDMIRYCEGDIVALEDLFIYIQNYIKHNTHAGTINGSLKASCPNCGSEDIGLLKTNFTAAGTIKREIECTPCGYVYEISNSAWRTFLELKSNNIIT